MNDAIANVEPVDLFDRGADPFSPAALRAKPNAVPIPVFKILVVGTPRPQGSKKAFYNAKLGRALVVDDNDTKLRTWRQDVVAHTVASIRASKFSRLPPHVPIALSITFMLPRPKGHWRTGRNAHLLRDEAPARPSTKPDLDKLTRSTFDALRDAGVYVDDAQIVDLCARKVWATDRPGAAIAVFQASGDAGESVARALA